MHIRFCAVLSTIEKKKKEKERTRNRKLRETRISKYEKHFNISIVRWVGRESGRGFTITQYRAKCTRMLAQSTSTPGDPLFKPEARQSKLFHSFNARTRFKIP